MGGIQKKGIIIEAVAPWWVTKKMSVKTGPQLPQPGREKKETQSRGLGSAQERLKGKEKRGIE